MYTATPDLIRTEGRGLSRRILVEFDEIEIARWLIAQGAGVNARAEIDADGFGGHTPLFACVVNDSYLCGRQRDGAFARLLLPIVLLSPGLNYQASCTANLSICLS